MSLAVGDYDHVRDLVTGLVQPAGITLLASVLAPEEIFHRFLAFREWDVAEMSLGAYVALRSAGTPAFTAIPVFPSRAFRHGAIYVRAGGRVRSPEDLAGSRVGIVEWAQTAAVWVRGLLMEDFGLRLEDIRWFQSGIADPGRPEKVEVNLPPGVVVVPRPDASLDAMLARGELDAVISARPPQSLSSGEAVQLWPRAAELELAYWRRSRVFPIMHLVVIRTELLEHHPWVAANLLAAFTQAKDHSLARLRSATTPLVPMPFLFERSREVMAEFGPDPWPYGLEANRITLDAFLGYAANQGLLTRPLRPDDLFVPGTLRAHRV